jgi:uncharacterized oxidoreductase
MKLEGNTILITGGSTGIGFELAKVLLERGNTVIITGRGADKLEAARQKLPKVITVKSDASRTEDIEALYAKVTREFPALNVLVNNAGIMRSINLQKETESLDSLTDEIDINFKGPVRMTRRFLGHLKSKPQAAIINVSSGLAYVPLPISPVYCGTKAALHSFTQSLRVQLGNTAVRVFELMPPATQTDLLTAFDQGDFEGVSLMPVAEMVKACVRGIEKDQWEIRPGQSNQLRLMSRVAPNFILSMLSKPVQRMHEAKS